MDPSTKWWLLSPKEACQQLESDPEKGLNHAEAKKRLKKHGKNRLPPPRTVSALSIFLSQFTSLIVWVLIVAAVIAGLLGEWIDAAAITAITIMNGVLGFFQEWRSIRSMEALTELTRPSSKVIREGELRSILSENIAPGDLVLLEAGDQIPADGRILKCSQLSTQEAALTGESLSIAKISESLPQESLALGDRTNMLFRSTTVAAGKGVMLVTATGLKTEIGKIATLLETIEERETPLQLRLQEIGNQLVLLCLFVVVAIFLMGQWRGFSAYDMIMTSLSLAVAAIPEGLPAVVTIALAIGMQRMAKRKALIRRLAAVETLGCTTVICTDKTGTLTENKMRVRTLWINLQEITVTGQGYIPEGSFILKGESCDPMQQEETRLLFEMAMLCNNANLEKIKGEWKITGDPTEAALLVVGRQAGLSHHALKKSVSVTDEIPFDSERRRMSVIIEKEGKKELYLKGAPDAVLELSDSILLNTKKESLTDDIRQKISSEIESLACQGLRVLGFAKREVKDGKTISGALEVHLTFIGLIAMNDPPRIEAKEAIQECVQAGIRPLMVTGDHKQTAVAVAKELDMHGKEGALNGIELDRLSDAELSDRLDHVSVFSRVSAEHKMRIIDAFQKKGEVVAMTGDGVNDAPAIDKADIGVAMGITGTDVTKSVSDLVILDDNFASIVHAVKEGRAIYDNILKFTSYLVSCNLAEILVIFFGIFFLTGYSGSESIVILAPIHLLWINLVTDGFPAIALALDPISPDAMHRPPRKSEDPFLSRQWVLRLVAVSFIICFITLGVFIITSQEGDPTLARSAALTALVLLEVSKPFILRAPYRLGGLSNMTLIGAVILSVVLHLGILYLPFFHEPFKTVALGYPEWEWIGVGVVILWGTAYPLMKWSTPYPTVNPT